MQTKKQKRRKIVNRKPRALEKRVKLKWQSVLIKIRT